MGSGSLHRPASSRNESRGDIRPRSAGTGTTGALRGPAARSVRRRSPSWAEPEPPGLRSGRRPPEGHAPLAQRDECVVADHEVIEQLDVQQPAGGERLGGEVEVVR